MKGILLLIEKLQKENQQLREHNRNLRRQKGHLATKLLDHRYTIKQLKNKINSDLTM
jgi:hypothetical protein